MSMMMCTACDRLCDTDYEFGSWEREDFPDDKPWICDVCCSEIDEPEPDGVIGGEV